MFCRSAANELAVPWQSLAERTKSRVDFLKIATDREQRITDLEQELKQVREAAIAEKRGSRTSLPKKSVRPRRPRHNSTHCPLVGQVVVLMILS
jgi:hypothetical protein